MKVCELFRETPFERVWGYLEEIYGASDDMKISHQNAYEKVSKKFPTDISDMLVCLRGIKEDDDFYIDVTGLKINSLSFDNIDNIESYALEFSKFSEWANYKVATASLKAFGKAVCAAEILWEMTFFSTEEEEIQDKIEEINSMVKDIQEGKCETRSFSDLLELFKDSLDEETIKEIVETDYSAKLEEENLKRKAFLLSVINEETI